MFRVREFDGTWNFEWCWSVPPGISELFSQQLTRSVPSGHREKTLRSWLALPIHGVLSACTHIPIGHELQTIHFVRPYLIVFQSWRHSHNTQPCLKHILCRSWHRNFSEGTWNVIWFRNISFTIPHTFSKRSAFFSCWFDLYVLSFRTVIW
jgi:hypothetical protein